MTLCRSRRTGPEGPISDREEGDDRYGEQNRDEPFSVA
jgi:hypothetical protein